MGRIYQGLRKLIIDYEIKPGERVSELEVSKRFGVSRTPVREALNRLIMDRLLGFEPNLGFHRPAINLQEIVDLYEFRVILETVGVKLAVARATDSEIQNVVDFWAGVTRDLARKSKSARITDDELFHERLIALSHNNELVEALKGVNARIHFVRWADPSGGLGAHKESYRQHMEVLRALKKRDAKGTVEILNRVIERRKEEIVAVLKEGAARLYIR